MPRIQPGSALPPQVRAARTSPSSAPRRTALLSCGAALAAALHFGAAPAAAWIEADPAVERTRAFLERTACVCRAGKIKTHTKRSCAH